MRLRLAVPLALGLALAAQAGPPAPNPPQKTAPTRVSTPDDAWVPRLTDALAMRDDARNRVIAGEAALSSARHRHHPRGEALAKIEKSLDDARKDYAATSERLPRLIEQAREAGVSPTALRPFEDAVDGEPPDSEPPADLDD